MTSLYNRATPSQQRILRVVEGAVKNASDAHPELQITPRAARSIAKRAAGTLTAQWPDVLAARAPSVGAAQTTCASGSRPASDLSKGPARGPRQLGSRSPLRLLRNQISAAVRPAKMAGQMERAETLVEVLKMIAKLGVPK